MPLNSPLVSIITVNYNQIDVSCELLKSAFENSYKNLEIFLVDNASKANPQEKINSLFPSVNVIRSDKNLGFAGGNNLAIPHCNGEFILFINNDAELTNGLIETLISSFEKNENLGIVSPKICYYPTHVSEPDIIQFVGTTALNSLTARNNTIGYHELDKGQHDHLNSTAYIHGAAMMTTKTVIRDVGNMSELFFLYYEELDWCERIRKAGYDIEVAPSTKIYHKESLSVGADSPLKTYYINRSRILFMRRHKTFLQFMIFTIFLIFAAIPKTTLTFLFKGKIDNLKAFYRALNWNLFNSAKDEQKSSIESLSSVNH